MSALTRTVSPHIASPLASTSRHISTSPPILAGGKGPSRKSVPRTGPGVTKPRGFVIKKDGSNRVATSSKGLTLRYSLASPLPDLGDFDQLHPEGFRAENVGRPTTFPRNTYQQIRQAGLPRLLEKELSSAGAPASVIRQATVDLVRSLESATSGSSKDARFMITGERGSGKSMLLLQTVSYCLESGWIVLYAPRAANWVDSTAPYGYHAASKTFHQPTIATSLLNSLLANNEQKLAQIKLSKTVIAGGQTIGAGQDLAEVVRSHARDDKASVEVLAAVMDALGVQTQFPVLFAIDEAHALFQRSTYRAPDYSPLESYSLSAPLLAIDYLSGRKTFVRLRRPAIAETSQARGAVLTAPSHSTPYLDVPSILLAALDLPTPHPVTPYTRYDPHHLAHASSGIKKVEVPYGMTPGEAAGMFEIWAKKGWAPKATDELFVGAFTAAAGNPKQMGKGLSYNFWAH